jgi:hypothetical protein
MAGYDPDSVSKRDVLSLLEEMITQQQGKCLRIARRLNPNLTPDDIMNPFDWPEVGQNSQFNYEDGLLAGLQGAHAALMAHFSHPRPTDPSGPKESE